MFVNATSGAILLLRTKRVAYPEDRESSDVTSNEHAILMISSLSPYHIESRFKDVTGISVYTIHVISGLNPW